MIFFDVDGTLLDDQSAVAAGLDALYARHRETLHVTRGVLGSTWERLTHEHFPRYLRGEISMDDQRRERMRALFEECSDTRSTADLDAAFAAYLAAFEHAWAVFPDVLGTLPRLSHETLGIITNGNHEQQLRKLEQTHIAGFFRAIITSEDCGVAKPDPRIFLKACERAGVAPADSFYVGDSWAVDVAGSRAAGLYPIWIRRQEIDAPAPVSDAPVIGSLEDLPSIIEGFRTR